MYRYDNYTDSFVRVDGDPNTGSTTVRVGVPLKESVIVQKTELTDECIDRIADTVVRKLTDRKTEPTGYNLSPVDKDINVRSKDEPKLSEIPNNCETCRNKGFEGCEQPCLGCGCCDFYEPKTEPQTDGILFKGNLKEGEYKLIKTSNGWVLEGNDIAYYGEPQSGKE